jgi:hypothetical protein
VKCRPTNYETPHYAVFFILLFTPFLSAPNIFLSALSSNILNLYSSFSETDQVPQPYKRTRKFIVLDSLILTFVDRREEKEKKIF